jgi:hypothetical protein
MKLFCCWTPAHQVLFDQCFAPSVPADFSLVSTTLEIAGRGDFLSAEFLRCIHEKIGLILASLRENGGELLVWSDIDIEFFNLSAARLAEELGDHDIAFQCEGARTPDINSGFFICRSGERTVSFFERVLEELRKEPESNEQLVINRLLATRSVDLSWTRLPMRYYARTHGWPPPSDLALYHANATMGRDGVGQKIRQFEELHFVRRYGAPALAWTCLKNIPKRLKRLARERLAPRARGQNA